MNKYQCIFCGKSIDKNKKTVTSLLITTNWQNENEEENQQVFCHLNCLKNNCYMPENIYIDEQ